MDSRGFSVGNPLASLKTDQIERDKTRLELEQRFTDAVTTLGAIVKDNAPSLIVDGATIDEDDEEDYYGYSAWKTWSLPIQIDGQECIIRFSDNYTLMMDGPLADKDSRDDWMELIEANNASMTSNDTEVVYGDKTVIWGTDYVSPDDGISEIDGVDVRDVQGFEVRLKYLEEFVAGLEGDLLPDESEPTEPN